MVRYASRKGKNKGSRKRNPRYTIRERKSRNRVRESKADFVIFFLVSALPYGCMIGAKDLARIASQCRHDAGSPNKVQAVKR